MSHFAYSSVMVGVLNNMEQIFYEMMTEGVAPVNALGFIFTMLYGVVKLIFMIAVICACSKYTSKD